MGFQHFDVDEEFKKNKELRRQDLDLLKEWVEKQPHLPKMTEPQVILFLHSCYYRSEAAKQAIDNFFTIRTHCPEFFSERNQKALEDGKIYMIAPLSSPSSQGDLVVYAKLLDADPNKYSFSGFLKILDMTAMVWLNSKGTNVGHVVVIDLIGVTFTHVAKIGIMQMKKFLTYLQEGMPVRLKGMHFLNAPPFMDKILALMKPFMKKELMDVLHIHSDNFETFYPYVPQRCLPKEYGGDSGTCLELNGNITKFVLDNVDFFEEEVKQVVDESKRPGKPKNAGDLFGVEGTFKKLDID